MSSDYEIDLVYDASTPVERLILVPSAGFAASATGIYYPPQTTQTFLLLPIQVSNLLVAAGAPVTELTGSVADPTFDKTYEYAGDIAKYLVSVNGILMFQLTVPGGNTYTVDARVVLSYQVGNQPEFAIIDDSYQTTGITSTADFFINLRSLLFKLIPQGARIKLRIYFKATRTAGAGGTTCGIYKYNDNQRTVTHISLQFKPAMNSSDQVAAGIGTS